MWFSQACQEVRTGPDLVGFGALFHTPESLGFHSPVMARAWVVVSFPIWGVQEMADRLMGLCTVFVCVFPSLPL